MSVMGLSASSGRAISGLDHLRQSVQTILMTPLGSRVMRRDFGSGLFELIDQNLTPLTFALIQAAVVDALGKWEPRLRITRVQADAVQEDLEQGHVTITIEGEYLPDGQEIVLDGVVL